MRRRPWPVELSAGRNFFATTSFRSALRAFPFDSGALTESGSSFRRGFFLTNSFDTGGIDADECVSASFKSSSASPNSSMYGSSKRDSSAAMSSCCTAACVDASAVDVVFSATRSVVSAVLCCFGTFSSRRGLLVRSGFAVDGAAGAAGSSRSSANGSMNTSVEVEVAGNWTGCWHPGHLTLRPANRGS